MKINLILLAAGNSRRFGSNKLLYELDGKPMYRHVVDEIARLDARVFAEKIVVSQYDEILEDLSSEGWTAIRNTEPEIGISRSLQLGISKARQPEQVDAWCFVVADQPYLKAETIEGLVLEYKRAFREEGKTCGCVKCEDHLGNPCVFASVHLEELMNLTGDVGGKKVLKKHLEECFCWEVEEKELVDVDRKAENEDERKTRMENQEIVCYCSNVTKGEIIDALKQGAKTLDDVRKATGACTKGDCKNLSPRGKCCSPIIMQVIEEYQREV